MHPEHYYKPQDAPPHPFRLFEREKKAYAHLVHYGACDKGIVPKCYGWLELSNDDVENILSLPGISESLQSLKRDEGLPKALLLEYLPNATRISVDNISLELADAALRSFYHIHASYVVHRDVHGRNILVLEGGRVVWIDFDAAWTANEIVAEVPIRRQMMVDELARAWTYLYPELVSAILFGALSPSFSLCVRSSPISVLGSDTGCTDIHLLANLYLVRCLK